MSAFAAGRAGAVGKVPSRPEFLPIPSSPPSFAALDAWLTQATEWAAAAAGPRWPEASARGAMHGFVFRTPSGAADAALCGAVAPSRDSAGRFFPLAVATPLQLPAELMRRPELLPFVLEGPWARATAACAELLADSRSDPSALPALVDGNDAEMTEPAQSYDEWVSSLAADELWALLGPALGEPAATIRMLLETLAPARGVERPTTTLSLRVPLGQAGGAALCVWLDLVRRSAGWQQTVPSFFWSHDGTDGAALLHLGVPSKRALAELWMPSGERDEIVDLTRPANAAWADACAPLPPRISAALSTPGATVAELLAAFGT